MNGAHHERFRRFAGLPACQYRRRDGRSWAGMDRHAARSRKIALNRDQGDVVVCADQSGIGAAAGADADWFVGSPSVECAEVRAPHLHARRLFGRLLAPPRTAWRSRACNALRPRPCCTKPAWSCRCSPISPSVEARFTGRPTLLILDEAWVFLDTRCLPRASANGRGFARRTCRSFATQSLRTSLTSIAWPSSRAARSASSCRMSVRWSRCRPRSL